MFPTIQAHRDLRRIIARYAVELPNAEVQNAWISGKLYHLKWLKARGMIRAIATFRAEYLAAGFLRASPRGMKIIASLGLHEDHLMHWAIVSKMDVNTVRRAHKAFGDTLVHLLFPQNQNVFGPFDIQHLTRETFSWCLRWMAPTHIEPFLARACCGGTPIHVFVSALKWCRAQKRSLSAAVYSEILRWAIFNDNAGVAIYIVEHMGRDGVIIDPLNLDGICVNRGYGGDCNCSQRFERVATLEQVMRMVGVDYASLMRVRPYQSRNIRAWIDRAVAAGTRVV